MRWQGGKQSGNIEDRRGLGPTAAVGGLGAAGVVAVLIGVFVFGVDPNEMISAVSDPAASEQGAVRGAPTDEAGRFVGAVETSTTAVWDDLFRQSGKAYTPTAGVVLYDQQTPTGCGPGQAAMGPFYCPADHKVYLDLAFWNELESRFGAKGDFARAYVIAHEIGHHVQFLRDELAEGQAFRAQGEGGGQVRVELQADCYAGVWAARTGAATAGEVDLEAGDIEEGLTAASSVGDDTIQRKTQGRVVPDSFTHGTSEQRMRWFKRGYDSGDPGQCDTFRAAAL
jgi:predicted metalloprotease